MLRSAASKVMWVGRATVFLVGLAVILAVIFGVASTAFGKNGDNFMLGVLTNTATDTTRLSGNVSGRPALQINNPNTAVGSRALQLGVAQGKPPILVNATAGKATNLNADKVDGLSSERLRGAYARVHPGSGTPSLDTSYTSGFTSVSRLGTGLYCLEPASGFQVRGRAIAVSVDWNYTFDPEGNATAMFNGDCGTNGIAIRTERQSHSSTADVLLSNEADDIGFNVLVP